MKISVIGAGNMAFHLCKVLFEHGNVIQEICNRTVERAAEIASFCGARAIGKLSDLKKDSDLYLLCISDDAIVEVMNTMDKLLPRSAMFAHTSGNVSNKELARIHMKSGCVYPLQSIRKDRKPDFLHVPFIITSKDLEVQKTLFNLVRGISERVLIMKDEEKTKLHLPAVFVNNFVNFLYHIAYTYCKEENLDFDLLLPLLDETSKRILDGGIPHHLQTGPAIRRDMETMKRHYDILERYPGFQKIYECLSNEIKKLSDAHST